LLTTSCVRKRIICFVNDSLPKSFWIWKSVRDSITRKLDCASGDPHKPENLRKVQETYRPAFCIYVADLPSDRVAALKNGFSYIKPEDFNIVEDYQM